MKLLRSSPDSVIRLLLAFHATLLLSCSTSTNAKWLPADGDEVIEEINRYVALRKSWKPSEYRIEKKGSEGSYAVYHVLFRKDLTIRHPGGGESFDVLYDPRKRKIVKTLYFQ